MTDLIFYSNLIMFILNTIIFLFLMSEPNLKYKFVRVLILVAMSVGAVINFGKFTVFTVLFMFTPFITLIKIKQHGKLHRTIEKLRAYFGWDKQHLQNVQRSSKAVS